MSILNNWERIFENVDFLWCSSPWEDIVIETTITVTCSQLANSPSLTVYYHSIQYTSEFGKMPGKSTHVFSVRNIPVHSLIVTEHIANNLIRTAVSNVEQVAYICFYVYMVLNISDNTATTRTLPVSTYCCDTGSWSELPTWTDANDGEDILQHVLPHLLTITVALFIVHPHYSLRRESMVALLIEHTVALFIVLCGIIHCAEWHYSLFTSFCSSAFGRIVLKARVQGPCVIIWKVVIIRYKWRVLLPWYTTRGYTTRVNRSDYNTRGLASSRHTNKIPKLISN